MENIKDDVCLFNMTDDSFTIEDGVLKAYHHSGGRIEIVIPNGVTSIGAGAFDGCSDLASIVIPNGVTSIGEGAFCCCWGLASIVIPNSVSSIGGDAFSDCMSLSSVAVDKGNKVYDSRNDCNAIIETKTNKLVRGCKNTVIPNGVTCIGEGAFDGCFDLRSIVIPNGVTSIGDNAFCGCDSLRSIVIPNGVTSIGEGAFRGCDGLRSIVIPNSVTSIGKRAFYGCKSLSSVAVDKDNKVYDSRNGCNAIIETKTNELVRGCKNTVIPNGVTSIGAGAFCGCYGLRSIVIPNSVTSIGGDAFSDCMSLSSVAVDKDNKVYDSRNGCNAIIETKTNELVCGCKNTVIPNDVTSIGEGAFRGCYGLSGIVIPNSVTSIGAGAFYGCYGLRSIVIPNSVTSIGKNAFSGRWPLIINCEVSSKPDGWDDNWNRDNAPVVWGFRPVVRGYKSDNK